ncbi:MAG TPA: hypothetical protein PKZ27_03145 [Rhodocyclaceae bacterium]|nr:hypothetical protein [Rhodocyclaceae bacterium]
MASTKSAATLDRETSQRVAARVTMTDLKSICADQAAEIAALKAERDELKAECSRKETWINRYAAQLKQARHVAATKRVDTTKPFGERCRAYLAATGEKGVTAPQLIAWEQAQAQA